MHGPTATYRTIKAFKSTTYRFRRKLWSSPVPPPPAIGRPLPAKVVCTRSVLHPARCLPSAARRRWLFASACLSIEKKFTSSDGTVRYLLQFSDGQSVETVWMPEGDGGEAGDGSDFGDAELSDLDQPAVPSGAARLRGEGWQRATICVSSQVGCAVDAPSA